MFMAILRKLFNSGGSAVDRNIELQDIESEIDVTPVTEIMQPAPSSPRVIYFDGRSDLIERGYWSSHKPKRVRRINLEPEVAAEPGATRRVNRLIQRGYYRSLRHAA